MGAFDLLVFVALAFVACTSASIVPPAAQIVGGKDASAGKYPYQVSLRHNNEHVCGGSIVGSRTIMTAAHCVSNEVPELKVHAGTIYSSEVGEVYSIKSISIHEGYSASAYINDIALIYLNAPIKFNENMQPINLTAVDIDKGPCTVTGWGRIEVNGPIPKRLQEINLMIYPYKKCLPYHTNNLHASHICTFTKVGKGVCFGDSGGPLVVNGVQIGITSFAYPCARGYPDVYTRVYSYLDWIAQKGIQ